MVQQKMYNLLWTSFIDSMLPGSPGDKCNIVDITVDFDFITSVISKMAAQIIAIEM